jgi:hypothetical protein
MPKFNIFDGSTGAASPAMDLDTQSGTLIIVYNPSNATSPLPADGSTRNMKVKLHKSGRITTLTLDE